jgi:hypothetical protein
LLSPCACSISCFFPFDCVHRTHVLPSIRPTMMAISPDGPFDRHNSFFCAMMIYKSFDVGVRSRDSLLTWSSFSFLWDFSMDCSNFKVCREKMRTGSI